MTAPGQLQLLVFDVDGTLTDGTVGYGSDGSTQRRFHLRDGMGFRLAREAGLPVAILTAKADPEVRRRMAGLKVDHFIEGCDDKAAGIAELARRSDIEPRHMAYLGDDLLDLPAMRLVGYPMAVADAAAPVRQAARYVTTLPGGHGAAREAIEHVLKAQERWEQAVARYAADAAGGQE